MSVTNNGAYGVDDSLVDYILGITFEIWEQGRVDLIDQYYDKETVVYALDGVTRGSQAMIDGTHSMLLAYADRLLLADDVIASGDTANGYSSHRVLSPMTNTGDSQFGAATNRAVRIMNMADCVVENAVITREWLARDNLALVRQLGIDVNDAARVIAASRTKTLTDWFSSDSDRLRSAGQGQWPKLQELMHALWLTDDESVLRSNYAEYAVLHRSPVELLSGRPAIGDHFAQLRKAFDCDAAVVDHVCSQPAGGEVENLAIRWAVCGRHRGDYLGIAATGKPVYIMGVTHRRVVAGRIAVEWTVFDSLGVMAQLI